MRTIALSSSNRNSASALVSSVLPTPVGPRNRNEPIGRFGILQPGARAADRVGYRSDRLVLSDDAAFQRVLHVQQLFAFARQHFVNRNTGPARHDTGDMFLGNSLLEHAARLGGLDIFQLSFKLRNDTVGEFTRSAPIAAALRHVELGSRLIQSLL